MRRLLLVVLVLASGLSCAKVEEFRLEDPPHCTQPFINWNGGLTLSIIKGGGTGQFDYDPAGQVQARMYGEYELATGKLAYTIEYDPNAWQQTTRVSGTDDGRGGYANENGDLDLWYSVTTTDVLGRDVVTDVREKREGCVLDRETITNGVLSKTLGTYEDNEFHYTRTTDPFVVSGTLRHDLTWSESWATDDGGVTSTSETNGDGDGYSKEDWDQLDSGAEWKGETERFIDGKTHFSYHYTGASGGDYDWDVTYDYAGDGDGSYTDGNGTCQIQYQAFACTLDCGGTVYSC
jgi:hypothetical protein